MLGDIQARIAEIQYRVASVSGQAPKAMGRLGTQGPSSDFDSIFSSALNQAESTISGQDIVDEASKYLGIPYKFGGENPSVGIDCSALVQLTYEKFGIDLPRVSADQARAGRPVSSISEAQLGDLVAFNTPVSHIGIYVGDNKIIEAPKTGDVVRVRDIGNRKITAIRRVLPDNTTVVAGKDLSRLDQSSPNQLASDMRLSALGLSTLNGLNANANLVTPTDQSLYSKLTNSAIATPSQYANLFIQAGKTHGVDPLLLASVARTESNFRNSAVSKVGAQGMMQFMPSTAEGMGVDPTNPVSAINGAARLLKGHKETFGSWELALAAYQSGAGNVRRQGGMPASSVTQNYVRKIMSLWSNAQS